MASNNTRTKKLLEGMGYWVGVTEHFNTFAHIRQDLFGFVDMVAVKKGVIMGTEGTLYVQTTDSTDHGKRVTKILGIAVAWSILQAGNEIAVISWGKNKKGRWEYRWEYVTVQRIIEYLTKSEGGGLSNGSREKSTGNS